MSEMESMISKCLLFAPDSLSRDHEVHDPWSAGLAEYSSMERVSNKSSEKEI